TACSVIYVADSTNNFQTFDPTTLAFSKIGPIDCPTFGPNVLSRGMAVDGNGVVWITSDASYDLYQIDPKTAHCTQTPFQPPPAWLNSGGIGFAASMPGSTAENLYVGTSQTLYEVDPQTFVITPIGAYQPNPNPVLAGGPSLAGTSDARLFGLWMGPP